MDYAEEDKDTINRLAKKIIRLLTGIEGTTAIGAIAVVLEHIRVDASLHEEDDEYHPGLRLRVMNMN